MSIGFLGTGLLGAGMIEAMLRRGEDVTVWNRSAAKARRLEALGAKVAETPAACVRGKQRVHLALSDDASVDDVLGQAEGSLDRESLLVDHTTTAPAKTSERYAHFEKGGVSFVHAPVFMTPQMCRDAKGVMLVSCPAERFERARPALAAMTGEVWHCGERPELAATFKLCGNAMILSIIGGLADVFSIASAQHVEPEGVLELFRRFKPAGNIESRGAKIVAGDFSASFELAMARKDLRLMIEAAAGGAPLAVLPGLAARFDELIARGHGQDDVSVVGIDSVKPR